MEKTRQSGEACHVDRIKDPAIIVIFGATGDLTFRKLFPSLFNLMASGLLENCVILGTGRTGLSDQEFREKMHRAVPEHPGLKSTWDSVQEKIFYQQVEYSGLETYTILASRIEKLNNTFTLDHNRLFYLSVPPGLYEPIITNLGESGLARQEKGGWSRLVIEKPFGRDLESARELNLLINRQFDEDQVYRIDHYLAKETVQNILMLRFANRIFEPLWNGDHIESITIEARESIGVGHRGSFYEQTGVIRDMFQNHMLQLLALVTMEPPGQLQPEQVRDERSRVLGRLVPFHMDKLNSRLVLGQYREGNGLPSYINEKGVNPGSRIPTYASMEVYLDTPRWNGVPIVMTAGKGLAEKKTCITLKFRDVPLNLFNHIEGHTGAANMLRLGIYPEEKVEMLFQSKRPGTRMCLRPGTMSFNYSQGFEEDRFDAYEKVLADCLMGDQTLFLRQDAIEQGWNFLTPVLEECDSTRCPALHYYRAGTDGPEPARETLSFNRLATS